MTTNDRFVIHSLIAYANRIGAEQINFRKYMVKIFSGAYYTERALIEIDADGEVKVTDEEYAPSDEERETIREEVARINFPTSIKASDDDLARLVPTLRSPLYETFPDFDDEDLIIMVQERREKDDGGKYFLPHTLFSDNVWRQMEPDGKLPMWHPVLKREEKRTRFMLWEGVKAAKAANRIVRERETSHPFYETLCLYEHWGIIGGAQAPHRTDFGPLRKRKPMEVINVCDNDFVGRSALQIVSKFYGGPMKGIFFDQRWPESWDIADPMPQKLFNAKGRYIGPALLELTTPATWATTWKPPATAKAKPTIEFCRNYLEEWYHTVQPVAFIHRDYPDRIHPAREFESLTRPFVHFDSKSTVKLSTMMEACKSNKVDQLSYDPSRPPGVYEIGQKSFYNTHVGSDIKPNNVDQKPWLDFMRYLIPSDGDRFFTERWIATLIARPDIRMRYGLLLVAPAQGIGKSSLVEAILAPLVGMNNYSPVIETAITESQFNEWATHKRLVCCHEIYSGHSWTTYHKLKHYGTDEYIRVNTKNLPTYRIQNWVHMVLISNYEKAVKLDAKDRRWLVPKLTEKILKSEYWMNFHRWLREEDGLGAIRNWANDFVARHGAILASDHSPTTDAKKEMIVESKSEDELMLMHALERLRDYVVEHKLLAVVADIAVLDTKLVEAVTLYNNHSGRNGPRETKFKPIDARRAARDAGWFVSRPIYCNLWDGSTKHSRLCFMNEELLALSNEELRERVKPIDLSSHIFELMKRGPAL